MGRKRNLYRYLKRGLKLAGLALAGLAVLVLVVSLIPASTGDMASRPDPPGDYDEAVRRAQTVIASEDGLVCETCHTRLLAHGHKTDRAVILIHGLTSSPEQFADLGEQLFDDGYNVLIVRMPWHGLKSHTVAELRHVTTGELRQFSDQSVDLAVGLGEEVTVVGLSGGGTITGWIAQNRGDVDRAVMIAPLFGLHYLPHFADNMMANLFVRLPDFDFTQSSEKPRESVYPGWSTRGVAEYLLFARAVWNQAGEAPPGVRDVVLVLNENDHTVSNSVNEKLVSTWESKGASVTRYQFPASMGLPHDYIDLTAIGDRKDEIYPVLIRLIEGEGG